MKVAHATRTAITTLSLGGILGLSALTATAAQADTQADAEVGATVEADLGSIVPIAIGFIVGANIIAGGPGPS